LARLEDRGRAGLDETSVRVLWDNQELPAEFLEIRSSPLEVRFSPPARLQDDTDHVVLIQAWDRAGNPVEAEPASYTVRLDERSPVLVAEDLSAEALRFVVFDPGGSGLDPESLSLQVDLRKQDVSLQSDGNTLLGSLREALLPGRHQAVLAGSDRAGNPFRFEIPFSIRVLEEGGEP
jgi:hypothetical protein